MALALEVAVMRDVARARLLRIPVFLPPIDRQAENKSSFLGPFLEIGEMK